MTGALIGFMLGQAALALLVRTGFQHGCRELSLFIWLGEWLNKRAARKAVEAMMLTCPVCGHRSDRVWNNITDLCAAPHCLCHKHGEGKIAWQPGN